MYSKLRNFKEGNVEKGGLKFVTNTFVSFN
jgi:hypothetical protein